MRRAQFEIMGLAVVMVVVAVGIFFVLSLSVNGSADEEPYEQFVEEQFAQNLIDATMKTSLEGCPTYTVSDALYWQLTGRNLARSSQAGSPCAEHVMLAQGGQPTTQDEWDARFAFVDELIGPLVTQYRGRAYALQVRRGCEASDIYGDRASCEKAEYGQCDPRVHRTGRAGKQTVSLYPQTDRLEVVLWICKP